MEENTQPEVLEQESRSQRGPSKLTIAAIAASLAGAGWFVFTFYYLELELPSPQSPEIAYLEQQLIFVVFYLAVVLLISGFVLAAVAVYRERRAVGLRSVLSGVALLIGIVLPLLAAYFVSLIFAAPF